jgi:plastocyanin
MNRRHALAGGLAALAAPRLAHARAKVHTVVIDKMAFGPPPKRVRVGDTILWVNRDMFRHTATARDKSFDVDLPPGAEARTVLKTAGVVAYYCRFHPGMTGRVRVGP